MRIHLRDLGPQPYLAKQIAHPRDQVALRESHAVIAQRIGDLCTDTQHRVKCIHRTLRYQRDTGQAQTAHGIIRKRGQLLTVQPDLAAIDRPGGRISLRIASAMVDLPEPDSPARPNRSRGRS